MEKRDYSVVSIKYIRGNFNIDSEGKDAWKHSKAGSNLMFFHLVGNLLLKKV
ncbi:MAG: molybdopterin-guanine dinucleotide biosynthesis protein MobB [Thermoplasmata archaeon]